jgi:hypothetical protein
MELERDRLPHRSKTTVTKEDVEHSMRGHSQLGVAPVQVREGLDAVLRNVEN